MAITIHQEPQLFTPATNEIIWTFESDQTSQANFSYKVELYIDTALFGTYEIYPMQGALSKFDASEYVRTFLSTHASFQDSFVCESFDQWNTVKIEIFESYGTPPSLHASSESANVICFNGALRYDYMSTWNHELFYINPENDTTPFWLTTYPSSNKQLVRRNQPFHAGMLAKKSVTEYELIIDMYDISGTSYYSYTGAVIIIERVTMLDISPGAMELNGWTSPTEWASCYYYEVRLKATSLINPADVAISSPYVLYLDNTCPRFQIINLYWVNKFGVIDQFNFDLLSEDSSSVTNYAYQRQRGEWNGTSFELFTGSPEKVSSMKSAEDRTIVNSDWMKPAVQNWLVRELYESPQVWWLRNGNFETVIVENNQNRLKSRFKDGLIQETVNLLRTYSYRSQLN